MHELVIPFYSVALIMVFSDSQDPSFSVIHYIPPKSIEGILLLGRTSRLGEREKRDIFVYIHTCMGVYNYDNYAWFDCMCKKKYAHDGPVAYRGPKKVNQDYILRQSHCPSTNEKPVQYPVLGIFTNRNWSCWFPTGIVFHLQSGVLCLTWNIHLCQISLLHIFGISLTPWNL